MALCLMPFLKIRFLKKDELLEIIENELCPLLDKMKNIDDTIHYIKIEDGCIVPGSRYRSAGKCEINIKAYRKDGLEIELKVEPKLKKIEFTATKKYGY